MDWGRGFSRVSVHLALGFLAKEMRSSWMVKVTLKGMERRLFRRRKAPGLESKGRGFRVWPFTVKEESAARNFSSSVLMI
jgi:hypothetical protein